MKDLTNPKWMYLKAALFVLMGLMTFALLLTPVPLGQRVALQLILVWSCARAYYFAFYVITHYIDPGYRYAGLLDFFLRLLRHRPWSAPWSRRRRIQPTQQRLRLLAQLRRANDVPRPLGVAYFPQLGFIGLLRSGNLGFAGPEHERLLSG